MSKHKIYCFNNGKWGNDDIYACAIGDDGQVVAGHICSHECYMEHDLGITSNAHHGSYNAAYGEGNWELELVRNPASHCGLQEAIRLNKEAADKATAATV